VTYGPPTSRNLVNDVSLPPPGLAERVMVAHFEGWRNFIETRILVFDGTIVDVLFTVTYPVPPEQLDTTCPRNVSSTSMRSSKRPSCSSAMTNCQSIIAAPGGIISGSNRPNGGAHFRFTLPAPTVAGPDSGVVGFIRRMHQPVR
jgi:hypothetical protein